jgi:exopolyphosphatase/guanosine-5'-triphosphate,3'-diphosphate pyrophosphatase
MEGLLPSEARTVRKLATLLRVANALDHSHQQAIKELKASQGREGVTLHLRTKQPLDLELWNVERQIANFRSVFGKRLSLHVSR